MAKTHNETTKSTLPRQWLSDQLRQTFSFYEPEFMKSVKQYADF